jgi:hypothetical protein
MQRSRAVMSPCPRLQLWVGAGPALATPRVGRRNAVFGAAARRSVGCVGRGYGADPHGQERSA